MKSIETPVLLIFFNRPNLVTKVIEEIKKVQPPRLYLVSDGPREGKEGESEIVQQCRELCLAAVDWECETIELFSDNNLGCQQRIYSGISKAFEREEELIILEDDCLPNESFFYFCEYMLKKYRNDSSVSMVSGNNLLDCREDKGDYYLSKYGSIWGWATWKKNWQKFNLKKMNNPDHLFELRHFGIQEKIIYYDLLNKVKKGALDTWDYLWDFSRFQSETKVVVPRLNMVSNIGFGAESTHTSSTDSPYANQEVFSIDKINELVSHENESTKYEDHYFRELLFLGPSHFLKCCVKAVLNYLRIR